jgi:two-component system, NarL family, sensor kinase
MATQELSAYVLVLGSSMILTLITAIILFIYLYQKKMNRKQAAFREIEKMLKREELKSAYALIEGGEKERKRIAEDLHDNLGSLLATLRMYTDTFLEKDKSGDLQNIAQKISMIAEQAAQETRRISHNLDSGLLKHFGLEVALMQLCETINISEKIKVDAFIDIHQSLDGDLSLNIYRIVQELFSNTLKHARASKVRVEVTQIHNEYLSLIFEDNGKGFNSKNIPPNGIGLQHLQSRVHRFNGELTIDSNENIGTTVIIEIPFQHGQEHH